MTINTIFPKLTSQEVVCIGWLARGKTLKETADIMNIRYTTVKTYLERIKNKLQVYRLSEAIYVASKHNLI